MKMRTLACAGATNAISGVSKRMAAPQQSNAPGHGVGHTDANNATQLAPARWRSACTRTPLPRIITWHSPWPSLDSLQHCTAQRLELILDTRTEVLRILDEVLSLGGRALAFETATPLLGAIPELDSMAVVTLITTLEDRFGILVDDDEISGDTFASVGTLNDFVAAKLAT